MKLPFFLAHWLLVLLLCLALPIRAAESGPLYFVQITDSHFGDANHLERGRRVVERINQLPVPVEFVVHTGDILADNILDPGVVRRSREVLAGLQPPYFLIPGNHDIPQAQAEQARQVFRDRFGPLAQVEEFSGVATIFLYVEPAARSWPRFADYDPLAELEQALKQTGDKPVLLFQHSPPVEGFFRNEMHQGWPEESRQRWEELVRRHPVRGVITGHFHKDELHWLGEVPIFVAPPVAGRSGRQATFRLYEYRDGKLSYRTFYLQ